MTRGSGGSLCLSGQRTFTSNLLPAYPGALGVLELQRKICNVAWVTSWDGIDNLLAVSDPVLQFECWYPLKFRNVVGDQYQAFAPGVSCNV